MSYVWAFVVGGAICVVGQLFIDYTKLSPARILTQTATIGNYPVVNNSACN